MKLALIAFSLAAASCHVGQLSDDVHAVSTQTVETEKSLKETVDKLNKVADGLVGFFESVTNPRVDVTTKPDPNAPTSLLQIILAACVSITVLASRILGMIHNSKLAVAKGNGGNG